MNPSHHASPSNRLLFFFVCLFFLVAREWHRGIVLGQDCSALNNKLLPNDYVFIIFVAL